MLQCDADLADSMHHIRHLYHPSTSCNVNFLVVHLLQQRAVCLQRLLQRWCNLVHCLSCLCILCVALTVVVLQLVEPCCSFIRCSDCCSMLLTQLCHFCVLILDSVDTQLRFGPANTTISSAHCCITAGAVVPGRIAYVEKLLCRSIDLLNLAESRLTTLPTRITL